MTSESVSAVVVGIVADGKNWTFLNSGLEGSAPERAKKATVVEEGGSCLWAAGTLKKNADWFGGYGRYRQCLLGGFELPKKQLGTYPTYVAAHSVMLVVPLHQSYQNTLSRKEASHVDGGRIQITIVLSFKQLIKRYRYYIKRIVRFNSMYLSNLHTRI